MIGPFGFEWPEVRRAPPELVARLQAIRPIARLLYWGDGRWMLGEQRWNAEKWRRACLMMDSFWESKREAGNCYLEDGPGIAFMKEAVLTLMGFAWIRDYLDPLDGRIVNDYQRMCWKEDQGRLDGDWIRSLDESDDRTGLMKRQAILRAKKEQDGRSIYRYAMRKARSVVVPSQLVVTG